MILRNRSTGGTGFCRRQLVERAHLQMRVGAFDDFQLADLVGDRQALAQVGKRGEALGLIDRLVHEFNRPDALDCRDSRPLPQTCAIRDGNYFHTRQVVRKLPILRAKTRWPGSEKFPLIRH